MDMCLKRCTADKEGVTGSWRKVHNDNNTNNVIICIPHKVFDNKQVKENEMGPTRSTHDEDKKYTNKFAAKPSEHRPL